jgi:hypothetical protein
MIDSCNSASQHKIVSVSENKRKFTVNNKSLFTINKVTVDDCYMREGVKKCDFLFEIIDEELKEVFYVELKGSDISHGIQQLEATLKHCLSLHKNVPRSCYIVASRVPKASTSTQKSKKEFKRKHSVMLYIDTKLKEVTV